MRPPAQFWCDGTADPVSDATPDLSPSLTSLSPCAPLLQDSEAGRRHLLPAEGAGHGGQGRARRVRGRGAHGGRRAALRDTGLHPRPVPGGAGGVRGAQRVAGQPGPLPHHLRVRRRRSSSTPWWHPSATTALSTAPPQRTLLTDSRGALWLAALLHVELDVMQRFFFSNAQLKMYVSPTCVGATQFGLSTILALLSLDLR